MTITSSLRFLYIFWGFALLCAMPTYIPGATPLASRPIKVHRFQEKMCPMSDQNLNCQKFPKVQRLWTCLPFRM